MIASLPMYATPRTAAADARLWSAIATNLSHAGHPAPQVLTLAPGDLLAHWTDPALVLSQTCGRPYKDHLHGRVHLVGTADYGVPGCPPGYYRSLVIARADDPRSDIAEFTGAIFAFNEPGSQSGWAALAAERPEILTGPRLQTGSHRASTLAVREGRADFAAIDAVTLRHLTAASEATGVKVIHGTEPRPGLPFITALSQDAAAIAQAVSDAIASLEKADRATLGLRSLVDIPAEDYLALPDPTIMPPRP
ncbi:phosphate/phosphite/phosphonate ABC transporter substrate-binding protein [Gymnodinialimonas hymeniacidonis]|uniref:phosphate/phosphite/phosphonate ABC transporter substrate-binding protein n=1 Tax=Gymnodinialimonas hymeniacidonis TaxID=3126508 RepID=UPI0034C6D119